MPWFTRTIITVRDTPPYGHSPTYQSSLTYLERQKCYGPDKKILFKKQLFYLEVKVQRRSLRYATAPYGHAPTYQLSLTYLERQKCYGLDKKILFKKQLFWPWGQRSRSHEGHYGTWNTSLWSCTHIRNIINLSRKTKKLWSGQASLRSGRKNHTKTICLPSFEGET